MGIAFLNEGTPQGNPRRKVGTMGPHHNWLHRRISVRNNEFATWAALREHLEKTLGTRDLAGRTAMELHQRKQKSDENIRQLGAKAACLARQAFPCNVVAAAENSNEE